MAYLQFLVSSGDEAQVTPAVQSSDADPPHALVEHPFENRTSQDIYLRSPKALVKARQTNCLPVVAVSAPHRKQS